MTNAVFPLLIKHNTFSFGAGIIIYSHLSQNPKQSSNHVIIPTRNKGRRTDNRVVCVQAFEAYCRLVQQEVRMAHVYVEIGLPFWIREGMDCWCALVMDSWYVLVRGWMDGHGVGFLNQIRFWFWPFGFFALFILISLQGYSCITLTLFCSFVLNLLCTR